jgi:hypothetical protein
MDNYTPESEESGHRKSLAIEVGQSLKGEDVVELDFSRTGKPTTLEQKASTDDCGRSASMPIGSCL